MEDKEKIISGITRGVYTEEEINNLTPYGKRLAQMPTTEFCKEWDRVMAGIRRRYNIKK